MVQRISAPSVKTWEGLKAKKQLRLRHIYRGCGDKIQSQFNDSCGPLKFSSLHYHFDAVYNIDQLNYNEDTMAKQDKLDLLLQKQDQLKAQIASEKAKIASEKRKLESKLKILVGSYFLKKYRDEKKMQELLSLMDQYLTRDIDRKVLPILRSEIANLSPPTASIRNDHSNNTGDSTT